MECYKPVSEVQLAVHSLPLRNTKTNNHIGGIHIDRLLVATTPTCQGYLRVDIIDKLRSTWTKEMSGEILVAV